jgi:CheY-like chemotaxis protein
MGDKTRALLVDDDAGMRLTLARILEGEGYEVAAFSNGADALAHADQWPFDIGLVDHRMSGMNGDEVCRQLGRIRPEATLYVITAHVSSDAADAALLAGAAGILYKPVDIPELLALIAEETAQPQPQTASAG